MRQPLGAFIQQKRRTDDRGARRRTPLDLDAARPPGLVFSPQRHGLSGEQCRLAASLLERAERRRPFTGSPEQRRFRRALRIAGIIASIKAGRVNNRHWGKRMMGKRGGKVMRDHALAHLRQWSPIARLAASVNREKRAAQAYYEAHGEPLALGKEPTQTREAERIQALTALWEEQQWQQQRDRLQW